MTMTPAGLKAKIITEMQSQGFDPTNSATNGEAEKYIEALATAIVEYIQDEAKAVDPGGTSPDNHSIT